MCGITGYLHPAFAADTFPSVTLAMLGQLAHRGPDEHGYFVDDVASLGVARLSVIDEAGGKQPLADPSDRFWIAYNGEVYNYLELRAELIGLGGSFRTQSDTEVVLQAWLAWGAAALARLNGGFAFAIYDRITRRLVLARDRWGKRPLFYARVREGLVFASEMKALLEYPEARFRWNPERLAAIFTTWTTLPDETAFDGIRQVPPGSCLVADRGDCTITPVVAADFTPPVFTGSRAEALETVRSRLLASVRLRLRADTEVGAYLSGGFDSAVVTQLAAGLSSRPVHTFSVGFADTRFDESSDQQDVSQTLGTVHSSLLVRNHDILDALPEAVWFAETPVFRTAFVPMFLLSRLVRQQGIKVVLTGEGSDELFLGYDIFKETLLRYRWKEMSDSERQAILVSIYRHESHFRAENVGALASVFGAHAGDRDGDLFSHQLRFANGRLARRLLRTESDGLDGLRRWIHGHRSSLTRASPVGRAQYLEADTLLAGYLLSTQGDRMAFAHGVENRCPFLDPDVAAVASALPEEWRLAGLVDEKQILKQAFADRLPARIVQKPKQPYVAPDKAVFAGAAARDYLTGPLSPTELSTVGCIDVPFATSLAGKVASASPERIAPREIQAFTLLLSLVFLDRGFVRRQFTRAPARGTLVVAHDARRSAGGVTRAGDA